MYRNLLNISICLLLAASCSSDEVVSQSSDVRLSVCLPQDVTPEVMRMSLYGSESESYLGDVNLTGTVSDNMFNSTIQLRQGAYDAFCYNLDAPNTFTNTGKNKSGLYFYTDRVTSDILARCNYADGSAVYHTPDIMYGAEFPGMTVDGHGTECNAEAELLTETWTVIVNGTGLQYAQAAGTVISGLPTTYHPYKSEADACGDLWTALSVSGAQVRGSFNVFKGIPASQQILKLNILDTKGKSYIYPLDCTELMSEARSRGIWTICPTGSIDLPKPDTTANTGGGFQPSLGEWNQQTGEIII